MQKQSIYGMDEGSRTPNLRFWKPLRYQLRHTHMFFILNGWSGRTRTCAISGSKPDALPLGDTPNSLLIIHIFFSPLLSVSP